MAPMIAIDVVVHQCTRPGFQPEALSVSSSDFLTTDG